MTKVLHLLPLLLATAGCLTLTPNHTEPFDPMAFDQREFRMPGEAYQEQLTGSDAEGQTSYRRYHDLFGNLFARHNYFRAIGKPVALETDDGGETPAPPFMLEGANAGQIGADLRAVRGGHVLKLTNDFRLDETHTVALHLADAPVRTALLNPVNGKTLVLRPEEDNAYRLTFAPGQTWLVCFGEFCRHFVFDGFYAPSGPRKEVAKLDGEWRGKRLDPNMFPLDGSSTVMVGDVPAVCKLAVQGCGERDVIMVNRRPVTLSTNELHTAHGSFLTADIAALLTTGPNEITFSPYGFRDSLRETCYLAGDFAVSGPPRSIVKENVAFALGDLTRQGYPFYGGTFALETTVDLPRRSRDARYLLTFPAFDAKVLHVIVNGFICDPIFTKPWEADISVALRPGLNTVRIELTNATKAGWRYPFATSSFGLLTPPVIVECPRVF